MEVYALDFDGVVCDSAGETGLTGWRAAARIWPEHPLDAPAEYAAAFRVIRPALEVGYDSLLMAGLVRAGVSAEAILADFQELKRELMARDRLDEAELIRVFGHTRDRWLELDPDGWLAVHTFFPGVVEAINAAAGPVFIITTKQHRFATALLERAGARIAPERVFGLEAGPKSGVLRELQARADLQHATFHFVEDRLRTLLKVAEETELAAVQLHFATWGYTGADALAEAAQHPRIQCHELEAFCRMIRGEVAGRGQVARMPV